MSIVKEYILRSQTRSLLQEICHKELILGRMTIKDTAVNRSTLLGECSGTECEKSQED